MHPMHFMWVTPEFIGVDFKTMCWHTPSWGGGGRCTTWGEALPERVTFSRLYLQPGKDVNFTS